MVMVGIVVVGLAGVVGEPVLQLEPVRRRRRRAPPTSPWLVALGPGHEVGDPPARREVVVDDRGRVGRRAPPALELARVGPQLPGPLDGGVELGGDRSWSGPRGPCWTCDGHGVGPPLLVGCVRRASRRSGRCGRARPLPAARAAGRPCGWCRRCRGRAARGPCAAWSRAPPPRARRRASAPRRSSSGSGGRGRRRCARLERAQDDVAPGGVGEGMEHPVRLLVRPDDLQPYGCR